MRFDSVVFLAFFVVAWAVWRLLPLRAAKFGTLASSLVFYGWWRWEYLLLIAFSAAIDYWAAKRIAASEDKAARLRWLLLSLVSNLGLLAFFKYTPLFVRTVLMLDAPPAPAPAWVDEWVVPVGISFYTFQTLTYTLDRYAGRVPPARSALEFALFVCYFPQLVAGPIVRARELLPQLEHRPEPSVGDVGAGLMRLLIGVTKKALIADPLRAAVVERGLSQAIGEERLAELLEAVRSEGGPVDLHGALQVSRLWACMDLPPIEMGTKPAVADPERELAEAETQLEAAADDPRAMARLAAACLALARQRIAAAQAGADLLLRDARSWHERALAAGADPAVLSAERARVAYWLGEHAEQERIATEALRARVPADSSRAARLRSWLSADRAAFVLAAEDPAFAEDARWLVDAGLRVAAAAPPIGSEAFATLDPRAEVARIVRTVRAAAAVACSSRAGEADWLALASAARIWSGVATEGEVLEAAVARLPGSNALRAALHDAGWRLGRVEWAVAVARRVASLHPPTGAEDDGIGAWYLGSAELYHAEVLRRRLQIDESLAAASRAARAFEAAEAHAWLADSARAWRARCHLARAHALLLRRAETEAADELVVAASIDAGRVVGGIRGTRDGLDRDLPDAIDGVFEWRLGRASRVDGPRLAAALDAALADDGAASQVLSMVADALLREGLRDDGREGVAARFEHLVREEDDPSTYWETRLGRLPTPAGDALLEKAVAVARLALRRAPASEVARRQLAQTLSVAAQREWSRGAVQAALPRLAEAASLVGLPAEQLDAASGRALLHTLRSDLGPARPMPRPGR